MHGEEALEVAIPEALNEGAIDIGEAVALRKCLRRAGQHPLVGGQAVFLLGQRRMHHLLLAAHGLALRYVAPARAVAVVLFVVELRDHVL